MSDTSSTLTWQPLPLNLRNPFRLSYGVSETRRSFWLRLDGDEGWGEAAIPPYYDVADEAMIAFWGEVGRTWERRGGLPDDPAEIEAWIDADSPPPARCALDLALHDRIARRCGLPLDRLLNLPRPPALPTSFTTASAEPDEMARLAAEVT